MRAAQGAQSLEAQRRRGKRPIASVVVTDNAEIASMARDSGFFVLRVETGEYDLRCLGALDVLAVLAGPLDGSDCDFLGVLASIEEGRPKSLSILTGYGVLAFLDVLLDGARRRAQLAEASDG